MPKHDTLSHSVGNIDAGGFVWIRQGVTCPWSEGWMYLDQVSSILLSSHILKQEFENRSITCKELLKNI